MENFSIIYIALTVFGIGITVIDFLGMLDSTNTADGDAEQGQTPPDNAAAHQGSYLDAGDLGLKIITRMLTMLRSLVYFCLGAGPTGIFGTLSGMSVGKTVLWSLGVGTGSLFLGWLLRNVLHRDLDSSIRSNELMMEKAEILIPVAPGAVGKALVRQFGKETEIYVRCRDARIGFAKHSTVRIIDYDESWYWVEPL